MNQTLNQLQVLATIPSESSKQQLDLIDKMVSLLSSKGPLEYQAIQVMNNSEVVTEDYDPSDIGELKRMKEAGRFDVYGAADTDWPEDATADPSGQPFILHH